MKTKNLALLIATLIPQAAMAQSAAWDDYLFTYTPGAGWSGEWKSGNESWDTFDSPLLGDVHFTFRGYTWARIDDPLDEGASGFFDLDPAWVANFAGVDAVKLTTPCEFEIGDRRYFKTWKGNGPEFSTEFGFDARVTEDDPGGLAAISHTDFRLVGEPRVFDSTEPAAFAVAVWGQVELVRAERAPDGGATLTLMAMAILGLAALRPRWQTVLR